MEIVSPCSSFGETLIATPPSATTKADVPSPSTPMTSKPSKKRRPQGLELDTSCAVTSSAATSSPKRKSSTCSGQLEDASDACSPKRQRNPTVKYFCTSCPLEFDNIVAWRSHHGKSHQREWKYLCPGQDCPAVFFGAEEFKRHHRNMHGCRRCVHTTSSQQPVSTGARGYGCGVCARYLSSEDAYIEHVGAHWEAGKTPSDWYYSRVIYGLLRRPGVDEAWNQLLRTKYVDPIRFPVFVWNRLAVGEGTASNAFGASLQEALEMLHEIPGLKAADVAAGAHTMAIRTPREHAMSWYAGLTPSTRYESCLGFDARLWNKMQHEWNRLHVANQPRTQRQQPFQNPQGYQSQEPQVPRGQQVQYAPTQPPRRMSAIPAGIQYLSPSPLFHRTNQQYQQRPQPRQQQQQQQHALSSPMHLDTPSTHCSSNVQMPQQIQQQCLPAQFPNQQHQLSSQDMFIDRQELQQPSQQPSLGVSSGFATPTMQTQFTGFPHHPQQQTPSSVASLDVTSPNFVISPSTSVYQQDSQHQGQPHGEWIGMVPGYAGTGRLGMGMAPGF